MSNINLGITPQSLQVGRPLASYTGVVIHAGQNDSGDEITYSAGDATGYVLDIDNPIGTQEMANAILAGLKLRGASYKPYEADAAMLDPSAEIGDSVSVNGNDSIIFRYSTNHSTMMASDVAAPYDEELDHEFTYEPKIQREFKRESAYARARITLTQSEITAEVVRATSAEETLSGRITIAADEISAEVVRATSAEETLSGRITIAADEIAAEVVRATAAEGTLSGRITIVADNITAEVQRATAAEGTLSGRITVNANDISSEVTRATAAEGNLSSRITQNATDITARVTKSGGASSSFAWTLTDSSWTLTSNSVNVLTVDSTGLAVNGSGTFSGQITATSGYIGSASQGFTISASAIYNGMTSLSDTAHNGVYIGTDGISLGAGAFKATASGSVSLKGTITFLNSDGTTAGTLSAADLQLGASRAATGYSSWDSAYTSTSVGGYCYGGAGYGYSYNEATQPSPTSYPTYFKAARLNVVEYLYYKGGTVNIIEKDGVKYLYLVGGGS